MAIPAVAWAKPLKVPKQALSHQPSITELPTDYFSQNSFITQKSWAFPKRPWREKNTRDILLSTRSALTLFHPPRTDPVPFTITTPAFPPILTTAQFPRHKIKKEATATLPPTACRWIARPDNQIFKQSYNAQEEFAEFQLPIQVSRLEIQQPPCLPQPHAISTEDLRSSLTFPHLDYPKAKIDAVIMMPFDIPLIRELYSCPQEAYLGSQRASLEPLPRPKFSIQSVNFINHHKPHLPAFAHAALLNEFAHLAFFHRSPTSNRPIHFNQSMHCINAVKPYSSIKDQEPDPIQPSLQPVGRQKSSTQTLPLLVANHLVYNPQLAVIQTAAIGKLWHGLNASGYHPCPVMPKQLSDTALVNVDLNIKLLAECVPTQAIGPSVQDVEITFFYPEPSSLILEPLPLTIALPTLNEAGFTIRDHMSTGFIHASIHHMIPKVSIPAKLTTSLIVVGDTPFPAKQLKQQNRSPFRLNTVDSVGQWVDCVLYISPLVISSREPFLPTFFLDAVPDPRPLLKIAGAFTLTQPLHLPMFSELAADCIALLPQDQSFKNAQHFNSIFRPTKELSRSRLSICLDSSLKELEKAPFRFQQFSTSIYDDRQYLITSASIPMHPASLSPLSELNSLSLLHEAKKQHQNSPVFARSDAYIRKFGHTPIFETYQAKSMPTATPKALTPPLITIPPQKLWHASDEQILIASIPTPLFDMQLALSEDVNRKNRLTFANLSGIPSLYELDTTTLNTELSVDLAWMPKANSKRYAYAITLKACETAHFTRIPQTLHFVIDNTLPLEKAKLSTYKGGILRALPYIHPDDSFNIISYEDGLVSFSPVPLAVTPSSKAAARAYLNELSLKRSHKKTNTYQMLNELYEELQDQPGLHTVLLLTDGQSLPYLSKKGEEARKLVLNNQRLFSLYPTSSGTQVAHRHLQILSAIQRGHPFHASSLVSFPRKFAAFVKKLDEPIARDLYPVILPSNPDAKHRLYTESPRLPNLYRSTPIVIYGETDSLEPFTLMLQARLKGRYVNISKKMTFSPHPSSSAQLFDQQIYDENAKFVSDLFHKSTKDALEQGNNILSLCKS